MTNSVVYTARLRVTSAGHLTSDVQLQSDVTGYYLCFSRRGRLVVKVTIYLFVYPYCLHMQGGSGPKTLGRHCPVSPFIMESIPILYINLYFANNW